MEKPIFTYLKKAEKTTNKIRLPLKFVEKYGQDYYMEIYDGYIVLKPMNLGGINGTSADKH